MTPKKLKKLAEKIRSLRRQAGSVHDRKLAEVAKSLGRQKAKGDGHPQYISALRPGRITIPAHSQPLKNGTTHAILDELEADVFHWKERLKSQKNGTSEESRIAE